MNRLLEKLRNEVAYAACSAKIAWKRVRHGPASNAIFALRMLDLRDQSESLTRQMWLMYVTFEDVICINHPHRQTELLATSVDIDRYLPRPRRHYRRITEEEETGGADKGDRKRVIRCDHQTLNKPAGCSVSNLSRSARFTGCTCGADREQQTSGRFCLEKQQIESVEVVSLDVRAVVVSYKEDFECNDQSLGLSGCKFGGHCPVCAGRVDRTKGVIRRDHSVWGDPRDRPGASTSTRALQTHGPKTNELTSDRGINGPLSNRTPAGPEVDKRAGVIPHLALMRSASRMKAGQFVTASPLVSGAKRHSLSEHASLTSDSARGFDSTAKALSRHTSPNGSGEMGVRSAAFHTSAWYPGSDYCLAKAVPGRGVTQISPALCGPVSRPECSRRSGERGSVQKQGEYLSQTAQTSPVNQSDMLSVITQAGCRRQVYPGQDIVYRSDRTDRKYRMRESTSSRKQSPLADDTQLSPVTISSGYESDSIPSPVQSELDKCGASVNTDDDHTDYFSQSDTYPKSETRDIKTPEESFGLLPSEVRSKQTPFIPTLTKSRFVRFGQHNNAPLSPSRSGQSPTNCLKQSHKLAKVTRSMYAIIHDLQDECARRKTRRHSCDAVQEKHGRGWTGGRGRVSLSPIVSPEFRSRADVLTQSESDENLHWSSPETLADDTPTHHAPLPGGGVFVSPTDTYAQIRKKQCAMSSVTQRLFHVDIKHQSRFEDDIVNPADRADDNCEREQVRRESLKQGYKYTKVSEAQSDNEHIYEVIPGDESMISSLGMGSCENPKLAKWSTVVNLDTKTELPPALPERTYQGGVKMEPPVPPRCSLKVSKDSATICGQSVQLESDSGNQDYAVVRKVKPTLDNMSLDGCLDRLEDEDVGSDLDSELYSRVCPPQPRQRNTFDFSDLTSETYCRLDPVKQVVDIDEWSPGDMLNFIDGIHEQHTPKTRDNIYRLLQNSKTRAKFSESLEIETRLLHKGLLCTTWDSDDVTKPMTSERFHCDFRQEIQPTYV